VERRSEEQVRHPVRGRREDGHDDDEQEVAEEDRLEVRVDGGRVGVGGRVAPAEQLAERRGEVVVVLQEKKESETESARNKRALATTDAAVAPLVRRVRAVSRGFSTNSSGFVLPA